MQRIETKYTLPHKQKMQKNEIVVKHVIPCVHATVWLYSMQHESAIMTQVLCDACLFDASTLTWKLREPTPFARCAHTAVALPSGEAPCSLYLVV